MTPEQLEILHQLEQLGFDEDYVNEMTAWAENDGKGVVLCILGCLPLFAIGMHMYALYNKMQ